MVLRARIPAVAIQLLLTVLAYAVDGAHEAHGGQLQASWVDNSGGVATTRLERRLSTEASFIHIADVPPGESTYTDTSLSSGQTYCYRALAYEANLVSPYSSVACATVASSTVTAVAVTKAGTGAGLVTSTPSGISCDPACAATFTGTSSVTLTAAPAAGSIFMGWSGGSCAGTSSCTLAGNASVTVTATFAKDSSTTPPPSQLDTSAPQVTLSVPATVTRKSRVTLSATASDNVGVVRVDFYVNGIRVLCSFSAAPYRCDWQVPASNKTFTLQATAADAAGNVGRSQPINVNPQ